MGSKGCDGCCSWITLNCFCILLVLLVIASSDNYSSIQDAKQYTDARCVITSDVITRESNTDVIVELFVVVYTSPQHFWNATSKFYASSIPSAQSSLDDLYEKQADDGGIVCYYKSDYDPTVKLHNRSIDDEYMWYIILVASSVLLGLLVLCMCIIWCTIHCSEK